MSLIIQLMIYLIILSAIVVFADDHTCCYGSSCPLPVFYQWSQYQYFIDNFGIINEDACCPHTPWLGSSGIDSGAIWEGDTLSLETACRCKHAQTCDGDNLADSIAYTCDGGYMTDTGCPDANVCNCCSAQDVGGINLNKGGCISINGGCLCVYNAGRDATGMTQRCDLATTVCIDDDHGVLSGEYNKIGFYYGFPQYQAPHYYLQVERYYDATYSYGAPRWTFKESPLSYESVARFNQDSFTAFDDITSFDGVITLRNGTIYKIGVSNGECSYPTPEPTYTPYPTPEPTYTPYPTPFPTSEHGNESSQTDETDIFPIIAIVVGAVTLITIILVVVYWIKKHTKKEPDQFYSNMDTIQ